VVGEWDRRGAFAGRTALLGRPRLRPRSTRTHRNRPQLPAAQEGGSPVGGRNHEVEP
jgi:hypothetical protein